MRIIRGIISTAISQAATLLSRRGTIDANRGRNDSRIYNKQTVRIRWRASVRMNLHDSPSIIALDESSKMNTSNEQVILRKHDIREILEKYIYQVISATDVYSFLMNLKTATNNVSAVNYEWITKCVRLSQLKIEIFDVQYKNFLQSAKRFIFPPMTWRMQGWLYAQILMQT